MNIWVAFGQFMSQIWNLFTSIPVPGTSFSFAQLGFFILFASLILRLIHRVFDLNSSEDKEKKSIFSFRKKSGD